MYKVAFFVGSLGIGGAERIVSELLINLPDNIEKHVILSRDKIDFPFKGQLHILNVNSSEKILQAFKNFFIKWWRLRALKKEYDFTHTISFMEGSNIINILTKRNDRVIVSVRTFLSSNEIKGIGKTIVRWLVKIFYNKADVVIANSNEMKHDLIVNFGIIEEKIIVITNTCDIKKINLLSRENKNEFEKIYNNPVIINVGRLINAKGHGNLLRIFKEIKMKIPECKLIILGDGELGEYLFNYSRRLGLLTFVIKDNQKFSNNYDVFFLGFQNNPYKFLRESLLFVLPSIREGFPNALVEAMACGVAVMSSDCSSGPREILAPDTDFLYKTDKREFAECGILMPIFNDESCSADDVLSKEEMEWANCIIKILKDKSGLKKYSRSARERAKDFSIEKIIKEWIVLLNA